MTPILSYIGFDTCGTFDGNFHDGHSSHDGYSFPDGHFRIVVHRLRPLAFEVLDT
jgi:hypothetical protein